MMPRFILIFILTFHLYATSNTQFHSVNLIKIKGQNITNIEKKIFSITLKHQLSMYGLELSKDSPYTLKINIEGFKKHISTYINPNKKTKAKYKGKIHINFTVYHDIKTIIYKGNINSNFDIEKTGQTKLDAIIKTKKYILKNLAKSVAYSINFHIPMITN